MNRPTVWVVKEQVRRDATGPQPMDYTAAYDFGDVKFITDFDMPLHPNSSLAAKWKENVTNFIKSFDDERDFVILTGQPLAIFLVGALMASAAKLPRILVWRREQGRYVAFDPVMQ